MAKGQRTGAIKRTFFNLEKSLSFPSQRKVNAEFLVILQANLPLPLVLLHRLNILAELALHVRSHRSANQLGKKRNISFLHCFQVLDLIIEKLPRAHPADMPQLQQGKKLLFHAVDDAKLDSPKGGKEMLELQDP